MKKQNEAENELKSSTRRYLCYEHEGAKALVQLSDAIQQIKEKGILTENRILEIINEIHSEPPGFKDPQDLATTIAVKLMKFQHATKRKINAVEIISKTYVETQYPSWSVNIMLENDEESESESFPLTC